MLKFLPKLCSLFGWNIVLYIADINYPSKVTIRIRNHEGSQGYGRSLAKQAQIQALKDADLADRAIDPQLGRPHGCIGRFLQNPMVIEQNHRRMARMVSNSTWTVNQIRFEGSNSLSRGYR